MRVTKAKEIEASPEAVWTIAGDLGNVSSWIPAIESSRLEGDIRHAEFAGGGGSARERIIDVDNAARWYVYEYLDGPLALKEYRSRFSVESAGDGRSVVTWDSELAAGSAEEEQGLAEAIGNIYENALIELAEQATR